METVIFADFVDIDDWQTRDLLIENLVRRSTTYGDFITAMDKAYGLSDHRGRYKYLAGIYRGEYAEQWQCYWQSRIGFENARITTSQDFKRVLTLAKSGQMENEDLLFLAVSKTFDFDQKKRILAAARENLNGNINGYRLLNWALRGEKLTSTELKYLLTDEVAPVVQTDQIRNETRAAEFAQAKIDRSLQQIDDFLNGEGKWDKNLTARQVELYMERSGWDMNVWECLRDKLTKYGVLGSRVKMAKYFEERLKEEVED